MSPRRWLPHDWLDEAIPAPLPNPSDWVGRLDDGTAAIVDSDGEFDPIALTEGQIVPFAWTEHFGQAAFRIDADGNWTCDTLEPIAPEGSSLCVGILGYGEIVAPDLAELAAIMDGWGMSDPEGEETIVFYCWSDQPVPFVFRDGKFHEVES